MIKRILQSLAALVFLLLFYLLTLVPLFIVRFNLDDSTYFRALAAWGALVLLSLVPVLSMLIRKIWFFPGSGQAIGENELRAILLSVNETRAPVRMAKKGKRLVAQWQYDDAEWCQRMAAENVKILYELYLKFEKNTHTIIMTDRYRKVNFSLCPIRIKTGFFARPGLILNIGLRKKLTMEEYEKRLPVDYSFRPFEIKAPVSGTILDNGWNIRLSLL